LCSLSDINSQIPITADLFFKESTELWILKIRFAPFEKDTTWEVPGGGCPHLHGNFGAADVEDVSAFTRDNGHDWGQILAASTWLE
jgi:uncharacterized protein (DUF952 family)